jgi:hypothetical protein
MIFLQRKTILWRCPMKSFEIEMRESLGRDIGRSLLLFQKPFQREPTSTPGPWMTLFDCPAVRAQPSKEHLFSAMQSAALSDFFKIPY